MSECNASPGNSGASQGRIEHQDSISVSEAPSQSSAASSTSTQWPSAPSSPDSQAQDVTRLQNILDRALHDPFSAHPDISAYLKSNVKKHCQQAARKIYDADVLLVVTGAGFSADSGLATYIDVADIDAYKSRGWKYRDLCKPPSFSDFSRLKIGGKMGGGGGEGNNAAAAKVAGRRQKDDLKNGNNMELDCMSENDSECVNCSENFNESDDDYQELFPSSLPDEDAINHPQYFYGFWGQCCNDYRRVKPHEGYDMIAQWGRDKNRGQKDRVCSQETSCVNGNWIADSKKQENSASAVAQEIRKITHSLEQGDGNDSCSSDGSESFHLKEDNEEEPYFVSPDKRAGAFFVFTSNVDGHSFDVFESHEIRECHGNVEMWQCHNFSCGTNAATCDGGSLDGIDGNNDDVRLQHAHQSNRRLWRLPMDHKFLVDCRSMCAPHSKTLGNVSDGATNASDIAASLSSPPAPKRRKSSMNDEPNVNSQGETCSNDSTCANDNDTVDILDTATALGGMMEDALTNHLEERVSENKSGIDTYRKEDIKGSKFQPAHVGDVYGKPRMCPLRHMCPPSTDYANKTDDIKSHNYFLPISEDENWPRCPRCHEAARPAVLMFDDLDWVYNLNQERRWQKWCNALLKLCKLRSRVCVNGSLNSDSASTVSDADISENGWEDVSEASAGQKIDQSPSVPTKKLPATATFPPPSQSSNLPQSPLRVAILEIGCGYNVPTCRMISERLVCELSKVGGDVTLVRINPSHPEPDDHVVEDFVISIMEKGLVALKMIQMEYDGLHEDMGI